MQGLFRLLHSDAHRHAFLSIYKGVPSQLADVAASQSAKTGEDKGTLLQFILCFEPHECLEFGNFEECPFVFLYQTVESRKMLCLPSLSFRNLIFIGLFADVALTI